jgi:hypothetical protein
MEKVQHANKVIYEKDEQQRRKIEKNKNEVSSIF